MAFVKIGDVVTFIDTHFVEHKALVTNVFGTEEWFQQYHPNGQPAINVLFVSEDVSRMDGYGRQIERYSSVSHISNNSAMANCWKEVSYL